MKTKSASEISKSASYQSLVSSRNRIGGLFTLIILVVYYGFIYLVGFQKELMGQSLSGGVTSFSVAFGLGVILVTIFLTGIYVWIANKKFDVLTDKIKSEASK